VRRPSLGQPLAVFAHDLAGRELGQGNRLGEQVGRPETFEQLQIVAGTARLLRRNQPLANATAIANGRVGKGLGAGRDGHLGIADLDRPRAVEEGLQRRHAGDRAGVGGAAIGELAPEHDLAAEIRGGGVGDHGAHHQEIHHLGIDLRPMDDP
jgi:hypothetical protein